MKRATMRSVLGPNVISEKKFLNFACFVAATGGQASPLGDLIARSVAHKSNEI